ncbi:MAG: YIP1 family protein [Myxococcaceae bacterium]
MSIASDMPCCAEHPSVLAVATCARCGSFTCADCVNLGGSEDALCVACFERKPTDLLPWDQLRELGLFRAWWRTTTAVMFHPGQTFSRVRKEGSFGGAMLYAALSAFLAWSTTGVLYCATVLFNLGRLPTEQSSTLMEGMIGSLAVFAFVPVAGLVGTLMTAGLDHFVLKLVGVRSSFEVTFRGAAFSLAPGLLGLIPLCGLYFVPVWVAVARVFAYRELHRTTFGRAAAGALIVPVLGFIVFCGGFSLLAYAFIPDN